MVTASCYGVNKKGMEGTLNSKCSLELSSPEAQTNQVKEKSGVLVCVSCDVCVSSQP